LTEPLCFDRLGNVFVLTLFFLSLVTKGLPLRPPEVEKRAKSKSNPARQIESPSLRAGLG
jgi:hypothetical protein